VIEKVEAGQTVTRTSIEDSSHPEWKAGDRVVLNSRGVGEIHWGGSTQKASLKGGRPIPLPEAFTARQAMAIGTSLDTRQASTWMPW
jgi:NADPH:quinone reductase-like Zn-dependent oxidoreductase